MSVSSAPARGARAAATAATSLASARPARSSRAWTRTSSFARWKPNSSTRRRSAASRPSAMRAPRFARRLRSIRSRSASSSSRARRQPLVAEPPPDERELPPVRLAVVLVADLRRVLGELALVARDRAVELVRDARRATVDRPSAARERAHLGRGSARPRAPARGRAPRAIVSGPACRVAVQVAADPACRSESGGGAPGNRCRYSASRRSAASSRLCSKNQSPWRISSTTRGRLERTSSVCQRSVISSAIASSTRARSGRVSAGRRAGRADRAIRSGRSRIVRRVASVGCAVSTSSSETSAAGAPARRRHGASCANASSSDSRGDRAARARTAAAGAGGGAARRCSRAGSRCANARSTVRLALEVEARAPPRAARPSARRRARAARERADALLVGEQLLALLLDEHAAEHVAQQPDVAAQRRVGLAPADGSACITASAARATAGPTASLMGQ